MNRDQLIIDLEKSEGFRPYIYDDKSGAPVVRGHTLEGNATLGIGWCPATNPLPHDKAIIICGWHIDDKWQTLIHAAPWVNDQPEPVQRALCNMAFNLGVTGLLKFNDFLGFIQQGKYAEAAADLDTTAWAKQVQKSRVDYIKGLIQQGHI